MIFFLSHCVLTSLTLFLLPVIEIFLRKKLGAAGCQNHSMFHEGVCETTPFCINCHGSHASNHKNCERYSLLRSKRQKKFVLWNQCRSMRQNVLLLLPTFLVRGSFGQQKATQTSGLCVLVLKHLIFHNFNIVQLKDLDTNTGADLEIFDRGGGARSTTPWGYIKIQVIINQSLTKYLSK